MGARGGYGLALSDAEMERRVVLRKYTLQKRLLHGWVDVTKPILKQTAEKRLKYVQRTVAGEFRLHRV